MEEQRQALQEAKREAEQAMSPHQRATMLRKELAAAQDHLGDKFIEVSELADQIAEMEDRLERVQEEAVDAQERILYLRGQIGDCEAQCSLAIVKTPGAQKDPSVEAEIQTKMQSVVADFLAAYKDRKGEEADKDSQRKVEEQAAELAAAMLAQLVPQVPSDNDMQDTEDNSRPEKAARKRQEGSRATSAFAAAMEEDQAGDEEVEDDDMGEGPWIQIGSNAAVNRLRRQLQCDNETSQAVVRRIQAVRRQHRKAEGGAARKAAPTSSATGQPSASATTGSRPSMWDSRSWSTRLRGDPREEDVNFPPLGAHETGAPLPATPRAPATPQGSPARAQGTGSVTELPSAGGTAGAAAENVLPGGVGLPDGCQSQSMVMGAGGPSPQNTSDRFMSRNKLVQPEMEYKARTYNQLQLYFANVTSWSSRAQVTYNSEAQP